MKLKYSSWEGTPTVYNDVEAWCYEFAKQQWVEVDNLELMDKTWDMSRQEFDQKFGPLPPLPSAAFHSGDNSR